MAERDLSDILATSKGARLIPVTGITERSMTSVLLAAMAHVKPFGDGVLLSIKARNRKQLGKRVPLTAYTEVWVPNDVQAGGKTGGVSLDGVVQVGSWTAIVEAKIANAGFRSDQMAKYVRIAARYGVDCVISLSNHLVVDPTHTPYNLPDDLSAKELNVDRLHTSWANLRTTAEILLTNPGTLEAEEKYLIEEVIYYMDHAGSGNRQTKQVTFPSMRRSWPKLVDSAAASSDWSPKGDAIEAAVGSWHEVERQISLELSILTGTRVRVKDAARPLDSRRESTKERLVSERQLSTTFCVEDGPGEITVVVDLRSSSIAAATTIDAPQDRGSTFRRISWLTKQLGESVRGAQHEKRGGQPLDFGKQNLEISAGYARKRRETESSRVKLAQAMDDWRLLEVREEGFALSNFRLRMESRAKGVRDLSKFPTLVWRLVHRFYDGVYQHIDRWEKGTPQVQTKGPTEDVVTDVASGPSTRADDGPADS